MTRVLFLVTVFFYLDTVFFLYGLFVLSCSSRTLSIQFIVIAMYHCILVSSWSLRQKRREKHLVLSHRYTIYQAET